MIKRFLALARRLHRDFQSLLNLRLPCELRKERRTQRQFHCRIRLADDRKRPTTHIVSAQRYEVVAQCPIELLRNLQAEESPRFLQRRFNFDLLPLRLRDWLDEPELLPDA